MDIKLKSIDELKKEILLELRILIRDSKPLPEKEHSIRKIQLLDIELKDRKLHILEELNNLEKITNWKFLQLYEDCIQYPKNAIYFRKYCSEEDLYLKECAICEEYIEGLASTSLKICDKCLDACETTISKEKNETLDHCFLFQTPEKDYWCSHSTKNTILLSTDKHHVKEGYIICLKCIQQEKINRKK